MLGARHAECPVPLATTLDEPPRDGLEEQADVPEAEELAPLEKGHSTRLVAGACLALVRLLDRIQSGPQIDKRLSPCSRPERVSAALLS